MLDAENSGSPPEGPFSLFTPGQIGFTDDGNHFIVIYKDTPEFGGVETGRIAIYEVDSNGRLSYPVVTTIGTGQFAFLTVEEDGVNFLLALDPSMDSVSTYVITSDGTLEVITQFVVGGTPGDFPCWVAMSGPYVYTANFLGHSLSSYQISDGFSASALETVAASSGGRESFPLDMAVAGNYLYQLYPGTGTIGVYIVRDNGALTLVGEFDGLEPSGPEEDAPTEAFTTVGGAVAGLVVVQV